MEPVYRDTNHPQRYTHQCVKTEILDPSNYRPETPEMITLSGPFFSFHVRLQMKDAEWETKAKERVTWKEKKKQVHLNTCHGSQQGRRTDLLEMCDSDRMSMCREADRQLLADWSISVWDLGPVLRWLQLLMPCGAADTRLNLQFSPITQTRHKAK